MKKRGRNLIAGVILVAAAMSAVEPPLFDERGPGRRMPPGPPGKWWMNEAVVQRLGLTDEQRKKMEDLFQQNRLKLIDLSASLQKEEAILEPLLAADRPEEAKILTQIDRIAQARAELEKANARMLVGFRSVLSLEQWSKLQTEHSGPRREEGHPPGRR